MNVAAIIPARGQSKGLPAKNVRPLLGQPLITHTIEQALGCDAITSVTVSTDDDQIADVALRAGAEVIRRGPALRNDAAATEPVIVHWLDALAERGETPDLVCLLQCTSPLRVPGDIAGAVQTLREQAADSLLSVVPFHGFTWAGGDDGARPTNYDPARRPRRQELAGRYVENGSIYLFTPQLLRDSGSRLAGRIAMHVMRPECALEIDTAADFAAVEALMRHSRQVTHDAH